MSAKTDIEENVCDIEDELIDHVIDWCYEADATGTHYAGMSYEQGVMAAIDWLRGEAEDPTQ